MIHYALILALFSPLLYAESDTEVLQKWTVQNEKKLNEKYSSIDSIWFEKECLTLAKKLAFTKISQCHLIQSPHINAYVFNNGHVYFSLALMKLLKNNHQWASILAHENAHVELQHYLKTLKKIKKPGLFFPKSKIKKLLKKHEKEADSWSKERLKHYGYQDEQIVYFLQRVKKKQGRRKSNHHLKLSTRATKAKKIEIINLDLIDNIKNLEQN